MPSKKIKKYVKKQCEIDDVARQQPIIVITKLYNEAYRAKQALKEQYAKCKDIPQERRVLIEKNLFVESMEDYKKAVQIFGALTDEAVRNGSIKKVEKGGNVGGTSKDKNGKDDNKRTRTGNAFATTVNPDCRGVLRNVNPVNARNPTVRACYECGSTDHVRSACPRLNRAQGPEENRPNQVAANNGGQGRGNQGN
ncbi:putative reverse transcriptase domain-containing protein [Tanacetum coccineum]